MDRDRVARVEDHGRRASDDVASAARRSPQMSEAAATHVRSMIMSGRLRPGDIVQPGLIGSALGISATPAREALQALRVEGFLELVPRRGFQVVPLNAQDIRDLFCAYALLAGELAARACARAEPEEIDELEALHHELRAASRRRDHRLVDEKNNEFHHHISQMAGSRKINWLTKLAEQYIPYSYDPPIVGWMEATLSDHLQILERFRERDREGVRDVMQEHIIKAGGLLADSFEMAQEGSSAPPTGDHCGPLADVRDAAGGCDVGQRVAGEQDEIGA